MNIFCKRFFLFVIFILMFNQMTFAFDASEEQVKIQSLLSGMVNDWNKGDVSDFMKAYKHSDATLYIATHVVRGYKAIQKRYVEHYSNIDKMGKLTVDELQIKILSPQYAYVIGKWSVKRSKENGGDVGGFSTLLLEKTKIGWRILVDHTS